MGIKQNLKCELARREFYEYCKLLYPQFYKKERKYLKTMCDTMQEFYYNDDEFMIVNAPPRHAKSFSATNYAEWLFGINPTLKIMSGSYNEDLSKNFSKKVRNTISTEKIGDNIIYSDIFPGTKIKFGSGEAKRWQTDKSNEVNYLATSPTGTATGFGANLLIIDDLIKNSEEANNSTVLEKQFEWFCFEGNTEVKTKKGNIKIKDIKTGDKVLCYNHSRCIIEEGEVIKVKSKDSLIYRLEFEDGKSVKTTGNHRFYTNKGYKTVEEILSYMQQGTTEEKEILFKRMLRCGEVSEKTEVKLLELWKGNNFGEGKSSEDVLFYKLSKSIQDKKFKIKIYSMEQNKGRNKREIQEMPKVWERFKLTRSSYRPRFKKQRIKQFNGFMSIVPFKLSQAIRLSQHDITRVYDIEVKGNHNFFANDILVHNCNTMLSRREGKKKVLIIMTRWSSKDLAGRMLDYIIENGYSYKHINFKAYDEETGKMLCDDIFNYSDYLKARALMGEDIFSANYQQIPIDLKGVLYSSLLEYEDLPRDKEGNLYYKSIENYTDTADTGGDYLASINYVVGFDNKAYIINILYTKEPMEVTEPLLSKMLLNDNVNYCRIESNNGGRGFSRNVERITRDLGNRTTTFKPFHQSGNKETRILTNATGVMQNILFPKGWKNKYREAYDSIRTYQREGKNKNDDIEDCLTGINEFLVKGSKRGWS